MSGKEDKVIYISSSCAIEPAICAAVEKIALNGYKNIELSGGAEYYDGLLDDLIKIKEKYGLEYLCHNYFPPEKEGIVVNIASLNDKIRNRSIAFLLRALDACEKLGSRKFGFHAGYYMDIDKNEFGRKISGKGAMRKKESTERFCDGYKTLLKHSAGSRIDLYVENNVYSYDNYQIYGSDTPLMLVTYEDFIRLSELINFKLLLDIGHLKVSSASLGLDLSSQLEQMLHISDYVHVSDNDGRSDQHKSLIQSFTGINGTADILSGKTITIEVCEEMKKVKATFEICKRMGAK